MADPPAAGELANLPVVKLVTCPSCRHDFGVPLTPTVPRKTVAAEAEASPAAGDLHTAGPAAWLSWRYGISPFAAFHDELRKRSGR